MTADLSHNTVSDGPYTLGAATAVSATSLTVTLTCDYDFPSPASDPRQIENVQIWVDGAFVTQLEDWGLNPKYHGHAVSETLIGQRATKTFILKRSLLQNASGDVQITLTVKAQNGQPVGPYLTLTASVPPLAVPTLRPNTIIRTLFHCPADEIQATPGLLDALRAASINTITQDIFTNPADFGATTIEQWRTHMDEAVQPRIDFIRSSGFMLLGIGNDFLRNQNQRDAVVNLPWMPDAIAETATRLRDSGVCVGVDVVDEVSDNPADYQPALGVFLAAWRSVPGAPPLAWPNQHPVAWEVPALSDYASRYWDTDENPPGRDGGNTIGQFVPGIGRAALDLDLSRPWLCQIGCNGPNYDKRVAGADYQPSDHLIDSGTRPQDVLAQVGLALARGCCGFRIYGYDWNLWKQERLNSPIGTNNLQTGVKLGSPLWCALSQAMGWVAAHEAALLAGFCQPVQVGPWVYGFRDALTFRVNTAERAVDGVPSGGVA